MIRTKNFFISVCGATLFGVVFMLSFSQNGYSADGKIDFSSGNFLTNNSLENFVTNAVCCKKKKPFQKRVSVTIGGTVAGNVGEVMIPEGKIFVIEQVTMTSRANENRVYEAYVRTELDEIIFHNLNISKSEFNGLFNYSISQQVKLYGKNSVYLGFADITPRVQGEPITNATFNFTISGYLANERDEN